MSTPLIYEVTLDVSADVATDFDAWLKQHVQAMLALPGFREARILRPEAGEAGQVRRVVQYTLGSRAELDRYLAEDAPRMRGDGAERFGDKMQASRRVLDVEQSAGALALPGLALPPDSLRCRNCGTPLAGKFCIECGQKNHTYVAPIWNVLHDFAATHFGFDTKFFHSIVPLLFRPGFLTREYCAGHEERYIKPFRLYLFSSILFFFLATLMWPNGFGNTGHVNLPGLHIMTAADKAQTRSDLNKAIQQIDQEPDSTPGKAFSKSMLEKQLAALDAPPPSTAAAAAAASAVNAAVAKAKAKQADGDADIIQLDKGDEDSLKTAAAKGGTQSQFFAALLKIKDNQAEFKKKLYQNLPKMMFVLMPLIALFLKLLYARSRRFLTEHFIFTLHYHAMLFVVMLFVMLLQFGGKYLHWLSPLSAEAGTVAGWYMVIYLFLAMRFFYGQGWGKTFFKFCLLFIGYWFSLLLALLGIVMLTAVEI